MKNRRLWPLTLAIAWLSFLGPDLHQHGYASQAPPNMPSDSCPISLNGDGEWVVRAEDLLEALKVAGTPLDCSGRLVQGELNLFELEPEQDDETKDSAISIRRKLKFEKAQFDSPVQSWDQKEDLEGQPRVIFFEPVNFNGARFMDSVSLDRAVFKQSASFGAAVFRRMASFTEAVFWEPAGFRSTQFDGRALFTKVKFHDAADFAVATFNWLAVFHRTEFLLPEEYRGANFLMTRFKGDTYFQKTKFKCTARFFGTRFHGPTYFSGAEFEDRVWFYGGTQFDNSVTFKDARFLRKKESSSGDTDYPPALFGGVTFARQAVFANAYLANVSFAEFGFAVDIGTNTTFKDKADFRGAQFGKLDLRDVVFKSAVDFTGAELGESVEVTDVDITDAALRVQWRQFLDDAGAPKLVWRKVFKDGEIITAFKDEVDEFQVFLAVLEKKFNEQGQLADAAEIHVLLEDTKRTYLDGLERLASTVFVKWIYGDGVRPWNQVLIAFVIIAGFALIFAREGALWHVIGAERRLRPRLMDIPIASAPPRGETRALERVVPADASRLLAYWYGLRFSFAVFTKFGYGGVIASTAYRHSVLFVWFTGLLIWVIFLINLSNRWPLLHKLVSVLS